MPCIDSHDSYGQLSDPDLLRVFSAQHNSGNITVATQRHEMECDPSSSLSFSFFAISPRRIAGAPHETQQR